MEKDNNDVCGTKSLCVYSQIKKFTFDLIDLSEQIRNGSLSVFSKVIDMAFKERYTEFINLGYWNTISVGSQDEKLEVLKSDVHVLNSAFYTKIAELELDGADLKMIKQRLDEHSELMSKCNSFYNQGVKKAKMELQNDVQA